MPISAHGRFFTCPWNNTRAEVVGLFCFQYTFSKNYDICEYFKCGRNDLLSGSKYWCKFESNKSFFTYVTHVIVINHHTPHFVISIVQNRFSLKYRFPFQMLRFFFFFFVLPYNHLVIFKYRFLKKNAFIKGGKSRHLFFAKLKTQIILLV